MSGVASILLGTLLTAAVPVSDLKLENCIPEEGGAAAVQVEYAGKTYGLRSEECRQLFESDPERYSQLYDALLELAKLGRKPPQRNDVSMVPS